MLSKYGNCTCLFKIKNKLKIGCFTNKVGKNSRYLMSVFSKTIIPLALVGYEMIIANSALSTISYPTNNCKITILPVVCASKTGFYASSSERVF